MYSGKSEGGEVCLGLHPNRLVAALLQIQKSVLKGESDTKECKRTKSHKIPIKPYQVIESKQKINLRESLSKRTVPNNKCIFNFKQ